MKVLVIGSGGREHALVWKIAQSPLAEKIYCAPGNPGTAQFAESVPLAAHDIAGLKKFALEKKIGLTVVGPEVPLVAGIADEFAAAGLKVFGPGRQGAQIEGSKVFSKNFMTKYDIPTAQSGTFRRLDEAVAYVKEMGAPIVVKADGLVEPGAVVVFGVGKILELLDIARDETKQLLLDGFPLVDRQAAGDQVVVEEFLDGEEASILALTDGISILPLASAQDHKRVQDGDMGPNTGGMGAYSPAPIVTDHLMSEIDVTVLKPFIDGMRQEGISYKGVIYAGIMVTADGPKVLEFNVRFGDPETQPIMLRLKSDFAALIEHGINGTLDKVEAEWDKRTALGVVMAAANYPDTPRKGDVITGLPKKLEDAHVFHAGTTMQDGKVVTNGGRVLCVVALGDMVKHAQNRAYEIADTIKFDGCQMRRDIGYRAIGRK